MTSDLLERLRAHGDQSPIKNSAEWIDFASLYLVEAADEIERLRAALEVCDRVLHFDLRRMITWGADYNQAVKDAADAARAALGEEP